MEESWKLDSSRMLEQITKLKSANDKLTDVLSHTKGLAVQVKSKCIDHISSFILLKIKLSITAIANFLVEKIRSIF